MNSVKLLHIKCCFSNFSIVRWHWKKNAPWKSWSDAPGPSSVTAQASLGYHPGPAWQHLPDRAPLIHRLHFGPSSVTARSQLGSARSPLEYRSGFARLLFELRSRSPHWPARFLLPRSGPVWSPLGHHSVTTRASSVIDAPFGRRSSPAGSHCLSPRLPFGHCSIGHRRSERAQLEHRSVAFRSGLDRSSPWRVPYDWLA